MYSEVAWVLLSSGTQVQPQIILELDCLPDYLSVSYDYAFTEKKNTIGKYMFKVSNKSN